MREDTIRFYFRIFIVDMIKVFGKKYLNRRPNEDEMKNIVEDIHRLVSQDVQGR